MPRRRRGGGDTGAGSGSVAGASKPGNDAGPPRLQIGFYNVGIKQNQLTSNKDRRKALSKLASDVDRLWASGVDVLVLCEVGDHEEGHADIEELRSFLQPVGRTLERSRASS